MPEKRVWLIFGLGNPGKRYQHTRHNTGFMIVDKLSEKYRISLKKKKFDAVFGRGLIDDIAVILVKPMTFMNRSGLSVSRFLKFYNLSDRDILVIHDDIDLDYGKLKIKEKGGDGGHKGIRSIIDALGKGDFCRLRIGIGRSEPQIDVSDYVLGPFSLDERSFLDTIIDKAQDAAVTIICKGIKEGMNRFN